MQEIKLYRLRILNNIEKFKSYLRREKKHYMKVFRSSFSRKVFPNFSMLGSNSQRQSPGINIPDLLTFFINVKLS